MKKKKSNFKAEPQMFVDKDETPPKNIFGTMSFESQQQAPWQRSATNCGLMRKWKRHQFVIGLA